MADPATESKNILLVDSDQAFGQILEQIIGRDYRIHQAVSVDQALALLDLKSPDAIVVNFDLPPDQEDAESDELFLEASAKPIPVPIIAYSWDGRGHRAQDAFRAGAQDILEQPIDIEQLKFALSRACLRTDLFRKLTEAQQPLEFNRIDGLLGNSKAMEQVSELAHKVSEVFTTVLITGESGTGKGLVAEAIHRLSTRGAKPFVAFSVCSFPDTLIEDELFGHERGAFTGASQMRRGRFEEAQGGTIFIDEIGDLALPLQAKLLRVLQERTVERLGSNLSRPIDVRVICATNRNLEKMVEEGTFREDLYFRISVVKIPMPALRERKEDIPALAEHFLRTFARTHNKSVRTFTPAFLNALAQHSWPGNVRELQNVMERSVVLANGTGYLGLCDLPQELSRLAPPESAAARSFHEAVDNFKQELVRSTLGMHGGNKSKAAQELGISRCYLHRLLNRGESESEMDAETDEQAAAPITPTPRELSKVRVDGRRASLGLRIA